MALSFSLERIVPRASPRRSLAPYSLRLISYEEYYGSDLSLLGGAARLRSQKGQRRASPMVHSTLIVERERPDVFRFFFPRDRFPLDLDRRRSLSFSFSLPLAAHDKDKKNRTKPLSLSHSNSLTL